MNQRPIKFRVWDIKHKWWYNDVLSLGVFCGNKDKDDFAIQQFTGLKDKNGKDIYEGDICNIRRYQHLDKIRKWIVGEVIWGCEHGWNFRTYYGKDFIGTRFTEVEEIEVIGNIFENPELLK